MKPQSTNISVYKVAESAEWRAAAAAGAYLGSAADLSDGFVHLSTKAQLAETLAKHFSGKTDLVVIRFFSGDLPDLRWEPSRGGDLFPHVYGAIDTQLAREVRPLPDEDQDRASAAAAL